MLLSPLSLPSSQKSGREINWVYLIHEIIKSADLFSDQDSGEFSLHRLLHPTSWKPPYPSLPLISRRLLHSPFRKSLNEPKTNPNLPPSPHLCFPDLYAVDYPMPPMGNFPNSSCNSSSGSSTCLLARMGQAQTQCLVSSIIRNGYVLTWKAGPPPEM